MKLRQATIIILSEIGFAIVYGILHDLVTAHVCVEYFTEFHPRILESKSPVVMALLWGLIATWWVGAIGGGLLSLAATLGSWPMLSTKRVLLAVLKSLAFTLSTAMIVLALTFAFKIYVFPRSGDDPAFFAVLATHTFSYAANFIAIVVLCIRIPWLRARLRVEGEA